MEIGLAGLTVHTFTLIYLTFTSSQNFISSKDVLKDFDALEAIQKEAARQVASYCSERGRLILKVRSREAQDISR